jgi:hypothetical protein
MGWVHGEETGLWVYGMVLEVERGWGGLYMCVCTSASLKYECTNQRMIDFLAISSFGRPLPTSPLFFRPTILHSSVLRLITQLVDVTILALSADNQGTLPADPGLIWPGMLAGPVPRITLV